MKYPNLIAIGGLKNSGKDTAAEMLQYLLNSPKWLHSYRLYKIFKKLFRKHYKITSFAAPLKRTLGALLDIPEKRFNDRDFKENYYIYFPTLEITNRPPIYKILSDSKFSRSVSNKDLTFIKSYYITIRQLLQVFGTECMREIFGDKLWILSTLKTKGYTIISDLRFKTEFQAIKENNGYTIYIHRDIAKPSNHASERELGEMLQNDLFDSVIDNNGSLEDLFISIKSIIKYYKK